MNHKLTIPLKKVFSELRAGNDISHQPMFAWLRDNASGDWEWEHMTDGIRVRFSFDKLNDYYAFKAKWWTKG